jgi:uncharacterized membrane protein YbaN (DUF454 family)
MKIDQWMLPMKAVSEQVVRTFLKVGACICIGLGVVGAFLPVLPTTPLFILAAVLSWNSSPRIRQWLLEHPVFGENIQNYIETRSIARKSLRRALTLLWVCLAMSIWFVGRSWIAVVLLVIGVLVTIYLLRLKRI